jgi:hypothetical protein
MIPRLNVFDLIGLIVQCTSVCVCLDLRDHPGFKETARSKAWYCKGPLCASSSLIPFPPHPFPAPLSPPQNPNRSRRQSQFRKKYGKAGSVRHLGLSNRNNILLQSRRALNRAILRSLDLLARRQLLLRRVVHRDARDLHYAH